MDLSFNYVETKVLDTIASVEEHPWMILWLQDLPGNGVLFLTYWFSQASVLLFRFRGQGIVIGYHHT